MQLTSPVSAGGGCNNSPSRAVVGGGRQWERMHPVLRQVREELYSGSYHSAVSTATHALQQAAASFSAKDGQSSKRGSKDVSSPSFSSSPPMHTMSSPSFTSPSGGSATKKELNPTQRVRILLLRADAFSQLGLHEKALADANTAISVSKQQSPQAYFIAGREHLKLLNLQDSVESFDIAEAILSGSPSSPILKLLAAEGGGGGSNNNQQKQYDASFLREEFRQTSTTEFEVDDPTSDLTIDSWALIGIDPRTMQVPPTAEQLLAMDLSTLDDSSDEDNMATTTTSDNDERHLSELGKKKKKAKLSIATNGGSNCNQDESGEGDMRRNGSAYASSKRTTAFAKPLVKGGYEWQMDLETWRIHADSARSLAKMSITHLVDSSSAWTACHLLQKKVAGGSTSRGVVVSIHNTMNFPLRYEFEIISDGGQFFEKTYRFPMCIPKDKVGVAALQNKSWHSGTKGLVCYSVDTSSSSASAWSDPSHHDSSARDSNRFGFIFHFEHPVVGAYQSAVSVHANVKDLASTKKEAKKLCDDCPKSSTVSHTHTWYPSTASSSTPVSKRKRFKAIANPASVIQTFSVSTVENFHLSPIDIISVLDFLPTSSLKFCSAVSWQWRWLINHLPPPCFYGVVRRSYPDYCLPTDYFRSPWTIADAKGVTWKLAYDGAMFDKDEASVSDIYGGKVFLFVGNFSARSIDCKVFYANKKCPAAVLSESWMPMSQTVTFSVPGGRSIGTLKIGSSADGVVEFLLPSETVAIAAHSPSLIRDAPGMLPHGAAGGAFHSVAPSVKSPTRLSSKVLYRAAISTRREEIFIVSPLMGNREVASAKFTGSKDKRGSTIAEITLQPGCDALIATMMIFYCRHRL